MPTSSNSSFLYENLTLILQLFLFRCFIKIVCSVLFQSHLFLFLCRGEEGKVFWCSARTWQTADSNQPGTRVDDDACAVFKRSHLDISCCTWRVNTSRPTTLLANMKTFFFLSFYVRAFFSNYSSLTGPPYPLQLFKRGGDLLISDVFSFYNYSVRFFCCFFLSFSLK